MTQEQTTYTPVKATPVKSFFVSMLTRDIKLEEAILDLLDNCVDGILRSKHDGSVSRNGSTDSDKPYEGFWAEISFDGDSFSIADNCGGIPWELSEYAFRMGRDPKRELDATGIVGVYGIGMKRAIFKMGRSCIISTQSGEHKYEVDITPEWIDNEEDWDIPVNPRQTFMSQDGTTIVVGDLYEGISTQFSEDSESFKSDLHSLISSHYAFIIEKGFQVTLNDDHVKPRSRALIFATPDESSKSAIQPFIYRATTDNNVDIFMAVGFTRPIPSQDEVLQEQSERRYSTEEAGWTVVCNDRAVLFCDRSELTGWGEAGVPRYHTQFIAISGIVEFKCDDPSELPMTTTKRGVDASSVLYLQAKNKMREGMKLFTDYTNRWKGQAEETKSQFEPGKELTFAELKAKAPELQFRSTPRSIPGSRQFRPSLPTPVRREPRRRRISFMKEIDDVSTVADYLFGDSKTNPSEVGEKCFDIILEEASN